ncbi:MAG: FmdB family zinc ribbon protein [bacterium]
MPIYEYRCGACGKKVTLLLGMVAEPSEEKCTFCGSPELTKLVSRFRRGRTEDDRVDEMADRLETIGEPDSPAEMRELVKEMGRAMEEDYSDDMEEMFETDMENPGLED